MDLLDFIVKTVLILVIAGFTIGAVALLRTGGGRHRD